MITNQVMKRPMGSFLVEQRTKDSMFNATNLLKQWNEASGEKKEITKFFDNDNTKEFISALMEEEKLNTQNSAYLKARGKNGGTWMHPILFVKFAMWLNPRFEVQVIKFVYDQMLKYRNDAGDALKGFDVYTVGDLVRNLRGRSELMKLRNLGRKSVWAILDFVEENNLDFKENGESEEDFYIRLNNKLSNQKD